MTDQTMPADKVEKIAAAMRAAMRRDDPYYSDGAFLEDMSRYIRDLEDLLPDPPLPTLADMTVEERRACRWMQADTETWGRAVILLPNEGGGRAVTLDQWGHVAYEVRDRVTPRPDLPRMEWPGTGQDGEEATKVDYVPVAGGRTAYGPWTVARLRKKPDTSDAVPESTLAVGSVWDDADALTRACEETGRDQVAATDRNDNVYVWDARRDDWRGHYRATPKSAPYTIIHTGREAADAVD